MTELFVKNLWLFLTLVVPGLVTYGSWRILLLFHNSTTTVIQQGLEKLDQSTLLTSCVIMALAVIQQGFGIFIEFLLRCWSVHTEERKQSWGLLFYSRFEPKVRTQVGEEGMQTIGQFFLSLNVLVGQAGLLIFFLWYGATGWTSALAFVLYTIIAVLIVTCVYRGIIARDLMVDSVTPR